MWALNSSTCVPSKTVRPMPTMPGRISRDRPSAASPPGDADRPRQRRRAAARGARTSELCMGINSGYTRRSAYGSRRNGRFVLTAEQRGLISSELPVVGRRASLRLLLSPIAGRRPCASAAWWYWSTSRRGYRLGLTCHRATRFRASSARPVEEAFFIVFMSKPLLCVTVTAPTMAELRRRRDAVADADLVELRLDTVSDPDVAGALGGRRSPVIVTCRPTWEGGTFAGSEEERQRLLARGAGARRRVRRRRVARRLRRPRRRRRRPADRAFLPRFRRRAGRSRRRACARCGSTGAEVVKVAATMTA